MLKNISRKEYNDFSKLNNSSSYLHSKEWNNVREKMNWSTELLGFFKDDKLVYALNIHYKKLPKINYYLAYASRGFIGDFTNNDNLKICIEELRAYLKNKKVYCFKIDPAIKRYDIDLKRNPLSDETNVTNNLINLGFKHLGYVDGFEGMQGRFTFINNLKDKSYEDVYNEYKATNRNKLRLANSYGVVIDKGNINDLEDFMYIINESAKNGGFINRSIEFFDILLKEYPEDKLELYFARLTKDSVYNAKEAILKESEEIKKTLIIDEDNLNKKQRNKLNENKKKIETLDKKINQIDNILKEIESSSNKEILLASSMFVREGNTVWYWYSGCVSKYRYIPATNSLLDFYIKKAIDDKVEYFDLLGASGVLDKNDKNYGLYLFKSTFGGEFIEYIGEFDLILNKCIYKTTNKILKIAQTSNDNKVLKILLKFVNKGE